mmetsp:Transcript_39772/g.45650  ORF Transcript_39772/g.45650 Transcript_39772/m.45650 type:complete len:128 (+) Transcript_39772:718-1101(+)
MDYLYSPGKSGKTVTELYGSPKCSNGFCMMFQWCPPHYNKTYQEHVLKGVPEQTVIIKGKVIDDGDVKDEDDRNERRYFPSKNANVIKVKDILMMAGIQDIEKIQGNGAIILLELNWKCFRDKIDDE